MAVMADVLADDNVDAIAMAMMPVFHLMTAVLMRSNENVTNQYY